jgi:phosphoribosyl 1,2-cyclic phosphodiesterase
MKLIVINSNSSGNSYALDAGGEILLLEAGCKMAEVKRHIDYRLSDVVGCCLSHRHGDHAKYATEYARFGVQVFCNQNVADHKQFPYGRCRILQAGDTASAGGFRFTPVTLYHDVPNFGYLIFHADMGTLFFASDTYKMDFDLVNVDHWLIEANYDDRILRANIEDGRIDRAQANRLMLSHMSLDNTVRYLKSCFSAGQGSALAKTITLCHLSERNSDPDLFRQTIAGAFGIPTYVARKGLTVELNKKL